MNRVHLIYPHGLRISCPDAIGRHLAAYLSSDFEVVLHDWDSTETIQPRPGDRLIGHPHPSPRTIFRLSARRPGWKRVVMLCPYAHGDLRQVAAWDTVLPQCDAYLAITGNYWMQTLPTSPFAHWAPRMRQLDLAVDRSDFPPVKRTWALPGSRRFLYIGHKAWVKNTAYLSRLARARPGMAFGWMGQSRGVIRGLVSHGPQDFSRPQGRALVASYDFVMTTGFSDANPAVLLEAMAWGLIPVCTPQSGYDGQPGIFNIPLHDEAGALAIIDRLQRMPPGELDRIQAENWKRLDDYFNWDRFSRQVRDGLRDETTAPLDRPPAETTLRLRWAAMRSPYAPWHPLNIARAIKRSLSSP